MKFLTRSQNRARKGRMIGGVREMLCFEAKCRVSRISDSSLALDRTIQEIAGIELETRFCRQHLKYTPACRVVHLGGFRQSLATAINHEIMVIASMAQAKLLVVGVNAFADSMGLQKIKRRAH